MRNRANSDKAGESASAQSRVRRHRKDAQAAIEPTYTLTSAAKKEILKARAKFLAQQPSEKAGAAAHIEVVEFLLAKERYAIECSHIREVCQLTELTPVPCTPPFVLGIINVRGQILSVIDIRRLFDLPQKGLSNVSKVIIVHSDDMEVGILADAVIGAGSVPLSELQPALPTLTEIRQEYLRGVTRDRLIVLDAAKLLSDERIIVREGAES